MWANGSPNTEIHLLSLKKYWVTTGYCMGIIPLLPSDIEQSRLHTLYRQLPTEDEDRRSRGVSYDKLTNQIITPDLQKSNHRGNL